MTAVYAPPVASGAAYAPPMASGAAYAPPLASGPTAPPASMFGTVPGYEDTVMGGENAAVYAPPLALGAAYAPPLVSAGMFGTVPGYADTVMGGGGYLPPPAPLTPVAPPTPAPDQSDWSIPSLSEDVARDVFKDYASSNCCYSKSPAVDGVITSMEPYHTYRYRLETFTESRSTEWAHKPHEGEPADFYTETAPRPWEITAPPPELFTDHIQDIRVPYTSSIKECHSCHASGTMRCEECDGSGSKRCWVCNGDGKKGEEDCSHCNSSGRERCSDCQGRGCEDCKTCDGKRQLLTYINLKVEWTNQLEDFVVQQNSGLEPDKLSDVTGKILFRINQYLVYPVLGFPDPAISQASERMVREHQTKYAQDNRILQQRQTVELIPITKVHYKWKGDGHVYHVYGNENHVSSDYPATCCCVIL